MDTVFVLYLMFESTTSSEYFKLLNNIMITCPCNLNDIEITRTCYHDVVQQFKIFATGHLKILSTPKIYTEIDNLPEG